MLLGFHDVFNLQISVIYRRYKNLNKKIDGVGLEFSSNYSVNPISLGTPDRFKDLNYLLEMRWLKDVVL